MAVRFRPWSSHVFSLCLLLDMPCFGAMTDSPTGYVYPDPNTLPTPCAYTTPSNHRPAADSAAINTPEAPDSFGPRKRQSIAQTRDKAATAAVDPSRPNSSYGSPALISSPMTTGCAAFSGQDRKNSILYDLVCCSNADRARLQPPNSSNRILLLYPADSCERS